VEDADRSVWDGALLHDCADEDQESTKGGGNGEFEEVEAMAPHRCANGFHHRCLQRRRGLVVALGDGQ